MSAAGMKNSNGLRMEYNPKEVASLTASQFHEDENKLDLHGLTTKKAINTLSQYLRYKENELKRGRDRTVRVTIITGWGRHTNGDGRGVIKEHVMEYLSKNNYRFEPEKPNVGCFSVKLKSLKYF